MIRCLVVDDEPLAREGLINYIEQLDYLQLVGEAKDPVEASNIISQQEVDVLFLDIQMPKITGLDYLRSLSNPPTVIITTAYPSYALEGFELSVLDYLVKPITFARFMQSTEKAKNKFAQAEGAAKDQNKQDHFFIKVDSKYEKIFYDEILFIEAMQNYIKIVTAEGHHLSLLSMKALLKELPESQFIQVHKSYIVNIDGIRTIDGNQLLIEDRKIPISRGLKTELIPKLMKGRLIKK